MCAMYHNMIILWKVSDFKGRFLKSGMSDFEGVPEHRISDFVPPERTEMGVSENVPPAVPCLRIFVSDVLMIVDLI